MKRYSRNILVTAENNGNQTGFNIYLVFSGQREYLSTHRHNGAMYGILKDGVRLADLQRCMQDMTVLTIYGRRVGIVDTKQFRNSMRYLLLAIEEYIEEREFCA